MYLHPQKAPPRPLLSVIMFYLCHHSDMDADWCMKAITQPGGYFIWVGNFVLHQASSTPNMYKVCSEWPLAKYICWALSRRREHLDMFFAPTRRNKLVRTARNVHAIPKWHWTNSFHSINWSIIMSWNQLASLILSWGKHDLCCKTLGYILDNLMGSSKNYIISIYLPLVLLGKKAKIKLPTLWCRMEQLCSINYSFRQIVTIKSHH